MEKCVTEEMARNHHGIGQVRRVHVHLPLHLLYAFGSMALAHLRDRSCCAAVSPQYRSQAVPLAAANPGSTSYED